MAIIALAVVLKRQSNNRMQHVATRERPISISKIQISISEVGAVPPLSPTLLPL